MCFILESEKKSDASAKDDKEQSGGETSIGQEQEHEQEQPTDSQTNTSQTKVALVVEKLKCVLCLFLFYGKWVLDKLIGYLNELSKDYRVVARELKKARREKRRKDSIKDYRSRDMITSESIDDDSVDAKVSDVCYSNLYTCE